jgi:antitoxin CptB
MKELDLLLRRYVDDRWPSAPGAEKAAFEQLLELPDPQLAAYLLGHETPPPALLGLVERLRTG